MIICNDVLWRPLLICDSFGSGVDDVRSIRQRDGYIRHTRMTRPIRCIVGDKINRTQAVERSVSVLHRCND